jgi:hypothetical protein
MMFNFFLERIIMDIKEESFLRDVENHQMIIIRDDDVNRHVRFQHPGSSCMLFDLITWPGYLCYTGDMGTFVFHRLRDMFEFFRTDREYNQRKGRQLSINLGYWSEKVEAADRHDGIEKFDEELFDHAVKSDVMAWIRDSFSDTTKEERRELWETVLNDVIGAESSSSGIFKQVAVSEFSYKVNDKVGDFYFQDFWDHNTNSYSQRFQWCCYAIAWGIQLYDDAKAEVVATNTATA